jgi:hypothetical protein
VGRVGALGARLLYAGAVSAILGIETSCDETAAAVVTHDYRVLSSVVESSIDQHRVFGGVVPEVAGRAHLSTLGPVVARALEEAGLDPHAPDVVGVAVTAGPGLVGSLLVGLGGLAVYRGVFLPSGVYRPKGPRPPNDDSPQDDEGTDGSAPDGPPEPPA